MEAKKHVFSPLEKKAFLDILKKYEAVVENKQTDGSSLKSKNMAWDRLTAEYNACPHSNVQATSKQLRRLWMNLKQRQRDALTKERQHRMATGGGPSTSDAIIDPDISQLTPGLLVRVDDSIDSDTAYEASIEASLTEGNPTNEATFEPVVIEEVLEVSNPAISPAPQLPTPTPPPPSHHRILTQPMSPPSTADTQSARSTQTSLLRQKSSIIEKEYADRCVRANELHELEKKLLAEKIREAKAKADLAELLLHQQSDVIAATRQE